MTEYPGARAGPAPAAACRGAAHGIPSRARAEEGDRAAVPREGGGRLVERRRPRNERRPVPQLVEDRLCDRLGRLRERRGEERIRKPAERAEGERGSHLDIEVARREPLRRPL